MSWPAESFPYALPLTLGHEGAGTVAALGDGVSGLREGDPVAVYGPWGCGLCAKCAEGKENYSSARRRARHPPAGLGAPGAMAEYLIVDDARHLVPLDGLDPVAAVPLTDAGLTPYHAIKRALPKLLPGSTAVVIGTGGLGHVAIQLLRAMARGPGDRPRRRGQARARPEGRGARERPVRRRGRREGTGTHRGHRRPGRVRLRRRGADRADRRGARRGGGRDQHRRDRRGRPARRLRRAAPSRCQSPYWGSRGEFVEVLDLARAGAVSVHTETYSLDEAPLAYERLHAGKVNGRAVILPNG